MKRLKYIHTIFVQKITIVLDWTLKHCCITIYVARDRFLYEMHVTYCLIFHIFSAIILSPVSSTPTERFEKKNRNGTSYCNSLTILTEVRKIMVANTNKNASDCFDTVCSARGHLKLTIEAFSTVKIVSLSLGVLHFLQGF